MKTDGKTENMGKEQYYDPNRIYDTEQNEQQEESPDPETPDEGSTNPKQNYLKLRKKRF